MAEAFDVIYRTLGITRRSRRPWFLVDADQTVRYRRVGENWLDPTRDAPPVDGMYEAVRRKSGDNVDTFGYRTRSDG